MKKLKKQKKHSERSNRYVKRKRDPFSEGTKNERKSERASAGLKIPESKEDKIKVCAKIAADLGEDISFEDLAEALKEIEAGICHKVEAASAQMVKLEDDDVENVAGGEGWCWSDYWCVMFDESPCIGSPETNCTISNWS